MSMIEIKLTFNTIAEAVAFMANNPAGAVQAAKPVAAVVADAPVKEAKPVKNAKEATTSTPKPSAEADAKATEPAATTAEVTYTELQQAVMKVVALGDKGKAALTEIAASFGLATFKGSDASVWGPAKAKIEAAHAELAGA